MNVPPEITYRGVTKSDDLDTLISEKILRLEKFCDHIGRCDVIVEQPNRAQQTGSPFRVRIDLTVPPGHELVAEERPTDHGRGEPLTKVIGDAFRAMERQLKRLNSRQHGDVKLHEEPRALITKIFPAEGYGFIADVATESEVYFHRHSVVGAVAFDELAVGMEVRFEEAAGEQGPQATTVQVVTSGQPKI